MGLIRSGNTELTPLSDDRTIDGLLRDNEQVLNACKKHNVNYVLIDDEYKINIDL